MTTGGGGGNVSFLDVIAAIGKYLCSPMGAASILPAAVPPIDIWLQILPISVIVKPAAYLLLLLSVIFALYLESARYITVTRTAASFSGMPRHAVFAFAGGVLCFLIFIVGSAAVDEFLPSTRTVVILMAWLCLTILACSLLFFTMALATLGLRTFIAVYRP